MVSAAIVAAPQVSDGLIRSGLKPDSIAAVMDVGTLDELQTQVNIWHRVDDEAGRILIMLSPRLPDRRTGTPDMPVKVSRPKRRVPQSSGTQV